MIWRLIKDFKSNIMFSAYYDFDIDTYNVYIFFMHEYVKSSLPMFPMFTILHPKLWVNFIETFQSLRLMSIVIKVFKGSNSQRWIMDISPIDSWKVKKTSLLIFPPRTFGLTIGLFTCAEVELEKNS